MVGENIKLLDKTFWMEAWFHLNGYVSNQNNCYWSSEYMHVFQNYHCVVKTWDKVCHFSSASKASYFWKKYWQKISTSNKMRTELEQQLLKGLWSTATRSFSSRWGLIFIWGHLEGFVFQKNSLPTLIKSWKFIIQTTAVMS